MLIICLILSLAAVGQASELPDDDPLHLILDQMAAADCCRFDFISVLESDVFDTIDSTIGTALIGPEANYDISLGPDRYLRTDEFLYSYSGENDQVTVERIGSAAAPDETIRFITQLDRHYEIRWATDKYLLSRKTIPDSNLPEILNLTLNEAGGLGKLFYIDDNGDTNWIVIIKSDFQSECDSTAFVPDFPDTTEVINLY